MKLKPIMFTLGLTLPIRALMEGLGNSVVYKVKSEVCLWNTDAPPGVHVIQILHCYIELLFVYFQKLVKCQGILICLYCRANQEWQWRNILLQLLSKTMTFKIH